LALDESFDSNAMGLALQIPTQNVQVTKRHVECPQFGKPQLRIWSLFFCPFHQARQVVEREFGALLACITERTQDGSEFINQQHTSTHLA
jgi:hypothetical protein